MAILSTDAYHKTSDPHITGIMDEAYAAALSLFRGMTAHAFNAYIDRQMAAYLASPGRSAAYQALPRRPWPISLSMSYMISYVISVKYV